MRDDAPVRCATDPCHSVDVSLADGLHLVFDSGSHGDTAFRPCIDEIYVDFFRSGTVEGLDTSCASNARPIPFTLQR